MAFADVARDGSVRKLSNFASATCETSRDADQAPDRRSSSRPCPTPHLTSDQYVRLLACIDAQGGATTLDVISHALPFVLQPISAVYDLCDAGILNVDWERAFDGDMHVWRVDF